MSGERVLLVGLGNPGAGYAAHRHNVGFMALDAIARRERLVWRRSRFHGDTAVGRVGDREALLLKPTTYMNESGRSVAAAARFYKVPAEDVFVFHDELDLPSGKLRIKRGGGAAGHNGLRSIDALFSNAYWRVRLGIGHPGDRRHVLGHVLRDFDEADRQWLDPLLAAIAEHAALLVTGDPPAFASRVALATAPPKPRSPGRPSPRPSPKGEGEEGMLGSVAQPSPSGEGASESERVRDRPTVSKDES